MGDALEIRIDLSGADAVAERFARVGDSVRLRVKAALAEAADEIVRGAQAGAPRRSGRLASSIERTDVYDTKADLTVKVRPWGRRPGQSSRNGNFAIGLFIERGLPAKRIFVRGRAIGKARSVKFGGGYMVRGKTFKVRGSGYYRNRPAIPAQPFFTPAVEDVRRTIIPRIEAAVAAAISSDAYGRAA